MKIESPPELEVLKATETFTHGHLPVVAAYCRRLDLVGLVNEMVPSQMTLRPGIVVQAMVLDTLSGRSPLYRIKDFVASQDGELLLGEEVRAEAFSDINVGRTLDSIFKAGPSKIVTELGARATKIFALDTSTPSYDTTSTSLWGDYRGCESDTPAPGTLITWGYSKDHRPDLKQFMTELLCVDRGVPIFGKNLDGNSSDKKSNNEILTRIGSIMAKHGLGPGAFIYVADSAMVTEENLEAADLFITRLPATYGECDRAICEAVEADAWEEIGSLSETPTQGNRPCAEYKAFETTVTLYERDYRAVVVHSSTHDKRRQKKHARLIEHSAKAITAAVKKIPASYACEADAKVAAKQLGKLSDKLHRVATTITPTTRRKPGRPPKNAPAPTTTHYELAWELIENSEEIERLNKMAGCFVLLTSVPAQGDDALDSAAVLRTYKGQYGVESDFAFLKDPLVVNDVFLKTPARIDALGMILIIALMVWRLMERSMRTHVKNTGKRLPGWVNRKTDKPTAFMMSTIVVGITVARIKGKHHLLCPPKPRAMAMLAAMGLDTNAYLDPHFRCKPIIPLQSG
jgi:transposase